MVAPPMSTPAKYRPAVVGRKLLAEAIDQLPALWTAEFLIERVVTARTDRRAIDTAEKALDDPRLSGKVRLCRDDLVEPIVRSYGTRNRRPPTPPRRRGMTPRSWNTRS